MPADDDQPSPVMPRRRRTDVVRLPEPGTLDKFLEQASTATLEAITAAFADAGNGTLVSAGQIVHGLVKGRIFVVLADEIRRLREVGKLPDNLGDTKHGLYTWAQLMRIIDDELPDPDRLEALKAMFYALNRVEATDAERISAWQIWQVTLQLNSGALILLKMLEERSQVQDQQHNPDRRTESGSILDELLRLHAGKLEECSLIFRLNTHPGATHILTFLGRQLCRNIRSWRVDLEAATQQQSRVVDRINRVCSAAASIFPPETATAGGTAHSEPVGPLQNTRAEGALTPDF
jgi:hypothetical protein